MPAFDYRAVDRNGVTVSGSLTAESERQVRRQLREMQLFPERITVVGQARNSQTPGSQAAGTETRAGRRAWTLGRLRTGYRLSNLDLALVLRQMGILLNSGLALDATLKMLGEQSESASQRRFVESMRAEINEGRSVSAALRRSPMQVPDSVIASISVGEETGHLHTVLLRLADEIELAAGNRQTLGRALVYPLTLLATAAVVVAVLMVWVVPRITTVFVSARQELPWITLLVVGLSDFFLAYGWWLLGGLILLLAGFRLWLIDQERRHGWHRLLVRMPGVGPWLRMSAVADWARSLGVLLASGVPAMGALRIAASVVSNLYMRRKFEQVTELMRRGNSLHAALREVDTGSAFLLHMVGSGEASSELDTMLQRVADYYQARLRSSVDTFLKLVNPLLIVLLGVMVLGIVAAVMLPLLEMNNMV